MNEKYRELAERLNKAREVELTDEERIDRYGNSWSRAMKALCFECNGTLKTDCGCPQCPLYNWMPSAKQSPYLWWALKMSTWKYHRREQ
jgi:hypothetical protein